MLYSEKFLTSNMQSHCHLADCIKAFDWVFLFLAFQL